MALISLVMRAAMRSTGGKLGARRARHLRRLAVLRRRHDHAGDLRARRAVEGLEVATPSLEPTTWCRSRSSILTACSRSSATAPARSARCSGRSWWSGSRCSRCSGSPRSSTTRRSCARCRRPTRSSSSSNEPGMASSRSAPSCSRSRAPRRSTPTWATSAGGRSAAPGSSLVLPALMLNYSARARSCCATRPPSTTRSTGSFPTRCSCRWCVLATLATVIASQAVISGAFSLTRQAVQLGFLPRLRDPPHLVEGDRAGVRPGRELGHLPGGRRAGRRLPLVDEPGGRVRHRRHRHARDRHDPVLRRRAPAVAQAAAGWPSAARSRS